MMITLIIIGLLIYAFIGTLVGIAVFKIRSETRKPIMSMVMDTGVNTSKYSAESDNTIAGIFSGVLWPMFGIGIGCGLLVMEIMRRVSKPE